MSRSLLLAVLLLANPAASHADDKDWSSYNGGPAGWRYNAGETALGKTTIGKLEEKWRFPAKGSDLTIGSVHVTPAIVGGEVYFGTATKPTFYKLGTDGTLKWSYSLAERAGGGALDFDRSGRLAKEAKGLGGVFSSALVAGDGVYFADGAGYLYGLDRATGKEKWKVDTRAKEFPDAHPLNSTFASPILADGKVVFAGGAFEQWFAHAPGYKGCNGRAYVVALDPQTGKVVWKYDVGPKPEALDPPIVIKDSWGEHTFHFGPATSTIWSTPSYDAASKTIFFGTDTNNSPRRPTKDDPHLATKYACAVIAIGADGKEKWVTQVNPGDVWRRGMRAYDPNTGRYLDQSIGDTPKVYAIERDGKKVTVVGAGCKNGGFYVFDATDGKLLDNTPVYAGKPKLPLDPAPDSRMLALPGALGGLQTGCATDGKSVFTNGLDAIMLGTQESERASLAAPTAGRVVCVSGDTRTERWRHERPKAAPASPLFGKEVGDPVASGVAVANGVVYFTTTISRKLVALDAASGDVLKDIDVGAVWSGPAVSRGRVYLGTGNILFSSADAFSLFPHQPNGAVVSFGLPGRDEVDGLDGGK